jgi:septal ring factor EnvC (AmiA/AmiB activator)
VKLSKHTIFVVPDGTRKVRQFRIPRALPYLVLLAFAAVQAHFFWIMRDYYDVRRQLPDMEALENENRYQKRQFTHLVSRIEEINQGMCELNRMSRRLRAMVNMEEIGGDGTDDDHQGIGGSNPLLKDPQYALANGHRELVRSLHKALDDLDAAIAHGGRDREELERFFENQKMLLACTPSVWPARGWLSSRFGNRISPFTGTKEFHKGIDIATRMGAPVTAPADGIVSDVVWDGGYGRTISINHGYGLVTKYGHLKSALAKAGQHVKRGETIALVGNSGRSTGPHLHYEVILNGVNVNPLRYIIDRN